MVVRVWRQASRARLIDGALVATDDERIAAAVREAGGEAMMTAPDHPSGTDRIAEVAGKVAGDIFMSVQGDQPFVAPQDLDALAAVMRADDSIDMATLATPIADEAEWTNPSKVKVVCAQNGDALYFSRAPVPFARDSREVPTAARRHIGVYAYRREFLMRFASMPQGVLEEIEKLEQLRALENGYRIRVVASVAPSLEVDTAEDLDRARALARSSRMT